MRQVLKTSFNIVGLLFVIVFMGFWFYLTDGYPGPDSDQVFASLYFAGFVFFTTPVIALLVWVYK